MASIVDYIQREHRSFAEKPFNPVDSLILSSLCYCNFDSMKLREGLRGASMPSTPRASTPVALFDILSLCDTKALSQNSWLENSTETDSLYDALRASRRYRTVSVVFFANESSDVVDKQFSATTFLLGNTALPAADVPTAGKTTGVSTANTPASNVAAAGAPTASVPAAGAPATGKAATDAKGSSAEGELRQVEQAAYVAFRGTDGTFSGWKEDFDMAYKSVVPSQRDAAAYLSGVASALDCPLILGGHSKGGNLAQYAALCVNEKTYKRIVAIYDHDGPSFLTDPSPRRSTAAYTAKLHKTVPESSAFGMLLERHSDYRVVQSNAFALFQHSPFSWIIEGDDFSYQDELNSSAQFFDEALDQWLRKISSAERKRFIETIYDLLSQTEATSWSGFQAELATNLATMVGAGSRLDPETRRFLGQTVTGLIGTLKDQTIERIRATSPAKIASSWRAKRG